MGGRLVALIPGSRMHHQRCGATVGQRLRAVDRQRGVGDAEAHLGADRNRRRHRRAHRADDPVQQRRLAGNSAAPPRWRLTQGAGQPKLRSIAGGASAASRAALPAMQSGSLPSNCTATGVPAAVRPPCCSSGEMRKKARVGNDDPDTRTNSVTAWS